MIDRGVEAYENGFQMQWLTILLVLVAACASTPPARTPADLGATNGVAYPHHVTPNEVEVDALWVKLVRGEFVGGHSRVVIRTAPNPGSGVRVGMFEQFSGGMGPQWRSTVWVAAVVAASTLGFELTEYEFIAESQGFIEGASAGALLAAGFLASMTGARIDPGATLTGSIQPDGTIGPVGGTYSKVLAAIEGGKRRIGIPVGATSTTGGRESVRDLAKARGVSLLELRDIHDAYQLLTGRLLARPSPLRPVHMRLPAATSAQLRAYGRSWHGQVVRQLAAVGDGVPEPARTLAAMSCEDVVAAQAMRRAGNVAAAYRREARAWAYARSAADVQRLAHLLGTGRQVEARALLTQRSERATTATAIRAIDILPTETVADHLRLTSTIELAMSSWGFDAVADNVLAKGQAFIASHPDQWSPAQLYGYLQEITPAL